jgi:4-amino-4-deoxy-L-arabinose transferase
VTDSKLPQNFIRVNMAELNHSRYVLTDSVGVAAGLAWELKRSDVLMFNQKGEVSYGLDYPDARSHFISDGDFPQWLAQARKQGDVSLVLQLSRGESIDQQDLPAADKVQVMNRLVLFWYSQQP